MKRNGWDSLKACTYQDLVNLSNLDVNAAVEKDIEETRAILTAKNGVGFKHYKHAQNVRARSVQFWSKCYIGIHFNAITFVRFLSDHEFIRMKAKNSMLKFMDNQEDYLMIVKAGEEAFTCIKNDILFAQNDKGYRRMIRVAYHIKRFNLGTGAYYGYSVSKSDTFDLNEYNTYMNIFRKKIPSWVWSVDTEAKDINFISFIKEALKDHELFDCLPDRLEGSKAFKKFILSAIVEATRLGISSAKITSHNKNVITKMSKELDFISKYIDKIGDITSNNTIIAIRKEFKKAGKKYPRKSGAFAQHLYTAIIDGYRIRDRDRLNDSIIRLNIKPSDKANKYMSILKDLNTSGSILQMIKDSMFNHRTWAMIELELKTELMKDDTIMLGHPYLTEDLETIRIKTKGDMIRAGVECQHCIGSYASSGDRYLFFREDTVCAQVAKHDLSIIQCYDYDDKITDISEKFSKKLKSMLVMVHEIQKKELMTIEQVQQGQAS